MAYRHKGPLVDGAGAAPSAGAAVLHVMLVAALAAAAQPPDLAAGTLMSAVLQNSSRAV